MGVEYVFDLTKKNYEVKDGRLIVKDKPQEGGLNEWVKKMVKEYNDAPSCSANRVFCVPCVYVVDNKGNVGKARCSGEDTFNLDIGTAIAYARLKGLPVHPALVGDTEQVKEPTKTEMFPEGTIITYHQLLPHCQVGNAVPPMLGEAVAKQIKLFLEDVDSGKHKV